MGMIGNQPANNFLAVTKDTFNGNASSYTLSKAATTNGVAVYVENVRQIPTTAYSVSGTTLTFTGTTPAGTGNVYVLHHNTPASTATHPAAQALEATSGTFSGAVTISSTDAGSSEDPDLILHRNSASPADSDQLGQIVFQGKNDNSEDVQYARIRSQSLDVSDGTEDGKLNLNVMHNGSMSGRMDFRGGQPTRLFGGDVEINDGDLYFKDAGKGIVLGATSNIDANTLDDYEEGTWTATATAYSGTFSASDEQYVKVGRMVHFDCVLSFSGSDSSRLTIAGLPYTATNTSGVAKYFAGGAYSDLMMLVSGTTLVGGNTGGDATYTSVSGMTARFSGTYMATA